MLGTVLSAKNTRENKISKVLALKELTIGSGRQVF